MDPTMKALIDAPLADAHRINVPGGKRSAPRAPKVEYDSYLPKASTKELRERRQRSVQAKIDALFDYYATTNLTPERVAHHMGLYRQEQTGTDDKDKPIFARVLDVERAATQLAWRRKQAA